MTRHNTLAAVLAVACLAGCASAPPQGNGAPADEDGGDSLETLNRATWQFNDTVDDYVLRPVAKTYRKVTPRPVRQGVTNFFNNLLTPVDIVNNLLQAKFVAAVSDTGRLLMNTTLGIGGIFDPATDAGLPVSDEDLGQTLAVWGVPAGPYLVLPLLGPSTLRDAVALYPDSQLTPLVQYHDSNVTDKLQILYGINTRERLLGTDRVIESAFDPYIFVREAYLQNRQFEIHDGDPPLDDVYGEYDDYDYEDLPAADDDEPG
ncbi:VacJ family lipoprotein [soil metagenome]